jgi:hypothetical protein
MKIYICAFKVVNHRNYRIRSLGVYRIW